LEEFHFCLVDFYVSVGFFSKAVQGIIAMVLHSLFGVLLYILLFSLLTGAVASGVAKIKKAPMIPFFMLGCASGFFLFISVMILLLVFAVVGGVFRLCEKCH